MATAETGRARRKTKRPPVHGQVRRADRPPIRQKTHSSPQPPQKHHFQSEEPAFRRPEERGAGQTIVYERFTGDRGQTARAPRKTGTAPATHPKEPVRSREKKKKKRRRGNGILIYSMILILILGVGAVLSLTVLFPVETIVIKGDSAYSDGEIQEASGITLDENLLRLNTSGSAQAICRQLPYIEAAQVSRGIPGTVEISVQAAQPSIAYQMDGQYVLCNASSKVLEIVPQMPDNLIEVLGAKLGTPVPGETLHYEDESQLALLKKLLGEMERQEFGGISQIDITDTVNISVLYDHRIRLLFGTSNDLPYKTTFAKKLLSERIEQSAAGELDLSRLSDVSGDVYFREARAHSPERQVDG